MGYYSHNFGNGTAMGRYWWVYIFAPAIGGLLSALFIRYIHIPNLKISKESAIN
jgi:glycerol uptake facilitator-like aquaporin